MRLTTWGCAGRGAVPTVSIDQRGDILPQAPLSDEEFMSRFHSNTLSGWGHDSMLRVVYLLLKEKGRSGKSASLITDELARVEGDNAHLTLNYFWLQMVTYYMAVIAKTNTASAVATTENVDKRQGGYGLTFNEFMAQPRCQPLRNQLLYQKYYSRGVIDRSSTEFALPDLKAFPTLV